MCDGEVRDTILMSEPERRLLSRTVWAFVLQHALGGLPMNVNSGGNVGERLMAVARGTTAKTGTTPLFG